MPKELEKSYNPKAIEEKIYGMWNDGGYFAADKDSKKPPFTIVIPPPNVTGQLHMGHALDDTLQDILIRYKRMNGFNALWVPGTDHAGIATQIKVEENLRVNEGLSRYDLGREKFLERVWDWKHQYGNRIINQLKKLGCSCDWSRERFTMDEGCSKAVKEVFVNLYEKDLIYRGHRIANWCPRCKTALSDAEVENPETNGFYWHIKYFVKDSDEFVVVATTRPETLFGDTAVAVNPEDERYKHLVGKKVVVPFVNREIPIITDEYADMEKGTGCVKITPAHDPNDFLVGGRHDLEQINVMNDDATLNEIAGKFCGMDRYDARKQMVAELEEMGVLVKVEPTVHNVGECYRCGTTIEPLISDQWFVKMEPLAKPAIDVVRDGTIKFIPENQSKKYFNWMENIHDWCISRQLWWGHRIPAYYCDKCGKMVVAKEDVLTCPDCGAEMRQDEDVLDTWFSSALWPFSTLGWPDENAEDLKKFYPTSTLVTGYDIITFWVSRMIFSGLEHTGKAPFDTVLIHGLVRDELGRKMSKSLGNGVDPLEVIDKYGADALRFTLVTGNSPGNDMRYSDKKVEASGNFANKIWNASRFMLMNMSDDTKPVLPANLNLEDKWILSKFNTAVKEITANLDKYELGVASAKIYEFVWDVLCDWYIELIKPRLFEKDSQTCKDAQSVLLYVLSGTLKLLHPFMPYITEEIWSNLGYDHPLIVAEWPKADDAYAYEAECEAMNRIIDAIRAVRNTRAQMNVPPSKKAKMVIVSDCNDSFNADTAVFFVKLASASEVEFADSFEADGSVSVVSDGAKIYIPMAEIIDTAKERARLEKELATAKSELERAEKKLANPAFTDKAPAALVEAEKAKIDKYTDMIKSVEEMLAKL